MILNETYTLNSGYKIPKIAFGTWQIDFTISDEDMKRLSQVEEIQSLNM